MPVVRPTESGPRGDRPPRVRADNPWSRCPRYFVGVVTLGGAFGGFGFGAGLNVATCLSARSKACRVLGFMASSGVRVYVSQHLCYTFNKKEVNGDGHETRADEPPFNR